jgi:hypothetical protein
MRQINKKNEEEIKIQNRVDDDRLRYMYGVPPKILKYEDGILDANMDELIHIAREAGLEISDRTAELLKSTTFDSENENYSNTLQGRERAYEELFNATAPLINEYLVNVDVGCDHRNKKRLVITPEGHGPVELVYYNPEVDDDPYETSDELGYYIEKGHLYPPKVILQNTILAISGKANEYMNTTRELEKAKNAITSLAEDNI